MSRSLTKSLPRARQWVTRRVAPGHVSSARRRAFSYNPRVVALEPGTRIGAYDVVGPLGAGGMGEVYRARDTTLHRDVAIKVLPSEFAADANRLERFEREARLLASLNHPNIAAIYGVEVMAPAQSGRSPSRALVLELVEGQGLDMRITSRAAAHRRSLRHRPTNRRRPRRRPRTRNRTPRPQAHQHPPHARRRGQGARFRAGEVRRRRCPRSRLDRARPDAVGRGARHRALHEPRAGARHDRLTGAPTSGPSAVCSTRCSPAGGRSPARRRRTRSRRSSNGSRTGPRCRQPPRRHYARLLARCLEKDPKRRLRDIADARDDLRTDVSATAGANPAESSSTNAAARSRFRWLPWAIAAAALGGRRGSEAAGWRRPPCLSTSCRSSPSTPG